MLPQNKPDRIRILFDDHRLVANAGLLLPATLARQMALSEQSLAPRIPGSWNIPSAPIAPQTHFSNSNLSRSANDSASATLTGTPRTNTSSVVS